MVKERSLACNGVGQKISTFQEDVARARGRALPQWDCKMIAALDAAYDEKGVATAAAVVFERFGDAVAQAACTATVEDVADYVPGQFFRRELPPLLAVLAKVAQKPDTLIVDGYVMLGDRPGLGGHLWERLDRRVTVIGVAKSRFAGAEAVEIIRGRSRKPLYVTAAGCNARAAAENIAAMHGPHRIPDLLKLADRLARGIA